MGEYMTISQAAEDYGRSEKAFRKLIERQKIPFRRHGRRILLKRAELDAFFDALPGLSLDDALQRQRTQ